MYIFLYVCRFDNSYNDYLQILFLSYHRQHQ